MHPILNVMALLGLGLLAAAPAASQTGASTTVVSSVQALNPAGEGRRLFLKLNCYGCHGMFATGGMGPNIVRAELSDVREVLLHGEDKGMRSYADYVSSRDISNLAAYLRSIGTVDEPKFMDWWVRVPTK